MQEIVTRTDDAYAEPEGEDAEDRWELGESQHIGSTVRFDQPDGINETSFNEEA
jgi:hypothetical protein